MVVGKQIRGGDFGVVAEREMVSWVAVVCRWFEGGFEDGLKMRISNVYL